MNPDRRELLATLGLGGAVGLAGCSLLDDESDDGGGGDGDITTPTDGDAGPTFDARARVEASLSGRATTRPEPDFSYDPVDAEVTESELFARVTAHPAADGRGDYLQFRPAERTATELASLLRDVSNVGTESTVVTTVRETAVELAGGDATEAATFVGTATVDGPIVVVVRASETEIARTLAEQSPFPLSSE